MKTDVAYLSVGGPVVGIDTFKYYLILLNT